MLVKIFNLIFYLEKKEGESQNYYTTTLSNILSRIYSIKLHRLYLNFKNESIKADYIYIASKSLK